MELLIQVLIAGITIGSIYSLIALGVVLIFKSSGVINFAQGSMVMVGAFITYALVVQFKLPILLSLALTFAISGLIGMIVERFVLRYLSGASLISVIMVTIGLAAIFKGLAQIAMDDGVPVSFGILTVDTVEQGIERAGTKAGNKGYDAAFSLIETLNVIKEAGLR